MSDRQEIERKAFETWQLSLRRPEWWLARHDAGKLKGEYRDIRVEQEWEAWCARAAIAKAGGAA